MDFMAMMGGGGMNGMGQSMGAGQQVPQTSRVAPLNTDPRAGDQQVKQALAVIIALLMKMGMNQQQATAQAPQMMAQQAQPQMQQPAMPAPQQQMPLGG